MVLELKNIQENKNSLFDRNEIKADVELDITPRREEALKAVCEKFSCSKDVVSIIRIDSNFGTKVFTIVADIYASKEAKEAVAVKRKKEIEADQKEIEAEKKVKEEAAKPAEEPVAAPKGVPSEEMKEGKETPIQKDTEEVTAPESVPSIDEAESKDNIQKDTEEMKKVPEQDSETKEVKKEVVAPEGVPSDKSEGKKSLGQGEVSAEKPVEKKE